MKKIVCIFISFIILISALLPCAYAQSNLDDYLELYEQWDNELITYTNNLCEEHDIPYSVVIAIIYHESRFKDNVGTKYVGLMQISTSSDVINFLKKNGVLTSASELYNPKTNILAGIMMLKYAKSKSSNKNDMIYIYAMGEGNVKKRKNAGLSYDNATKEIISLSDKYEVHFSENGIFKAVESVLEKMAIEFKLECRRSRI
jgi:soluble lytic murein transglycosylase-like protein